jgi:hypothetical protein
MDKYNKMFKLYEQKVNKPDEAELLDLDGFKEDVQHMSGMLLQIAKALEVSDTKAGLEGVSELFDKVKDLKDSLNKV